MPRREGGKPPLPADEIAARTLTTNDLEASGNWLWYILRVDSRIKVTGAGHHQTGHALAHRIPTRRGPPGSTTPGHIEADTVAHCGDTTAGNFVYSLTFTDLYSGWTELRAIWNKSGQAIRDHLKDIEANAPFALKSFLADNGSEFLNWPLYPYLTGRRWHRVPFTPSRACRKNDNAHVEQKNWTHVRQLFGHDRFERPQRVPLMNEF